MRTTLSKRVRPGLVQFVRNYGYPSRPITETVWIIEGTEALLEFPRNTVHDASNPHPEYGIYAPSTGINEYGTIELKGYENVIVYRVALSDVSRLLGLNRGWKQIGRGDAYAYVTQMVLKAGTST